MRRSLALAALIALLAASCLAFPAAAQDDRRHPRIGLVLSGGGARGAAHIGVLKVLDELRIPIDAVAGTSMGALVGGVYASGMTPQAMERRLVDVDWGSLLVDDPPRQRWPIRRKQRDIQPSFDFTLGIRNGKVLLPGGALAGQKVELLFAELVAGTETLRSFDRLPIPFRAVATDLENGRMKVFDSGPLPEVMRASMSVPGVFAPVELDGRIYVDGGLVRNLPVDVARTMGVDLVIAVNLGSSYLPRDRIRSVVGVMTQMVAILTEQNVEASLAQLRPGTDILISPDLGDIGAADFDRTAQAIRAGERAARTVAPRLAHLSLGPEEYAAWRSARSRPDSRDAPVGEVRIAGLERVNPAIFQSLVQGQLGRPLDRPRLESDIEAIYGLGDFRNIDYDLDPAGAGDRLKVAAHEKPWGPGYLSFGVGVASDFKGDGRFGLRATYRRAWLNDLGAEWVLSAQVGNVMGLYTELFQPLDVQRTIFVVPSAALGSTPVNVFRDDTRIARYELVRDTLGLDIGATLLGGNGEARLGAILGYATPKRDTGAAQMPERSYAENGLHAVFRYDTLDSAFLPRTGQRAVVDLRSPQPAMGADLSYNRVWAEWTGAVSKGANTLVGRVEGGSAFGGDMPYFDQLALGGFQHLSGYASEQLRGNEAAFGSVAYYRRLALLQSPLVRGVYAGGSLEVGTLEDTWEELTAPGIRYGGSLFLGLDTWIGPAYAGLGVNNQGEGTGYILIGWP